MKCQERRGVYPTHYDMFLMVPILFLSKIFPNLEGRFDHLFIFKVTFRVGLEKLVKFSQFNMTNSSKKYIYIYMTNLLCVMLKTLQIQLHRLY